VDSFRPDGIKASRNDAVMDTGLCALRTSCEDEENYGKRYSQNSISMAYAVVEV